MADTHYLGEYQTLSAVWKKFPNGGGYGDYVTILGVRHDWNESTNSWGDDPGDVNPALPEVVNHDIDVQGTVTARDGVKTADYIPGEAGAFIDGTGNAEFRSVDVDAMRVQDPITGDLLPLPDFIKKYKTELPPDWSDYSQIIQYDNVRILAFDPLTQDKFYTTIGALKKLISDSIAAGSTGGGTFNIEILRSDDPEGIPTDNNVFSSLKTILTIQAALGPIIGQYLSRLNPDEAQGLIKFLAGAEFGEFLSGILGGKGARIDELGNIEATSLALRGFLSAPEYRFNRITFVGDETIFSDMGTIEEVELLEGKLYRLTMRLEESDSLTFKVGDLVKGIYHYNTYGFSTSYMRVESVIDEYMDVLLVDNEDTPTLSNYPPTQFMKIARVGYAGVDFPERSRYVVASSKAGGIQVWDGCVDFLSGRIVASMDLSQAFKSQYGPLPTKDGLPYLYAAGIVTEHIIRIDYEGVPVREVYDRGTWEAGRIYYNNDDNGTDDVWHLGVRWRCFASSTTEEPSWTSADWVNIEGRPNMMVVIEQYYISTSSSELVGGVWTEEIPTWEEGKYIYSRSKILYQDGSEAFTDPVYVPILNGKSVTKIDVEYATSSSRQIAPTGGWQTTDPGVQPGEYLWSRTIVYYSDGNHEIFGEACISGNDGDPGDPGEDGITISPNQQGYTYRADLNGGIIGSLANGMVELTITSGSTPITCPSSISGGTPTTNGTYRVTRTLGNGITTNQSLSGGKYRITPATLTVDEASVELEIKIMMGGVVTSYPLTLTYRKQFDGADGKSTEFIFKGDISDTIAPTLPSTSQQDDWYGQGTANEWNDDLVEPTKALPYVWASQRKKVDGVWGAFTTPKVWLRYAENGEEGYTVLLSNENHTFTGTETTALTGSTSTQILVYSGVERVFPTSITVNTADLPTGMSRTISLETSSVTFNVTTSMTSPSGTIPITFVVEGRSMTILFSYSISFKGADGTAPGLIRLTTPFQLISIDSSGNMIPNNPFVVTGTPTNTTITTWRYATDGSYTSTTTPPTGVTRSGDTVTIDPLTVTFKTLNIRASNGSISDSITIVKVTDGASAPLLYLSASAQVMKCNPDNTPQTGQTISFEAKLQNVSGTATFVATPYNDAGTAQTAITLGGTGNTRTLTNAQWIAAYKRIEVVATLGSLTDKVTIHRLADGATGENVIVGFLTNENITLQASNAGVVSSFTPANGEFWVYDGTTKVTSGITFSKVSQTGCTAAITSAGVYSVSAMSADNATVVLRAVYGGVTIDKVLTLSKSKAGADGDGIVSTTIEYAKSSSGTAIPAEWSTSLPTPTQGWYLWTRTTTVYKISPTTVAYSISYWAEDGDPGDSVVHIYRQHPSKPATPSSGVANPTGWSRNPDYSLSIVSQTNWNAYGNWYQWVPESSTYEDTGIKAEGGPGQEAVAPIIIDDFWAFWDDTLQDYVKSAFSAIGDDGYPPSVGANGNWYQSEELTAVGNSSTSRITFTTYKDAQTITLELWADGHATYDYVYAGKLDTAASTSNYYDRVRGGRIIITYDVPTAGSHYIDIFWRKGISTIVGSNRGYYAIMNDVKVWRSATNVIGGVYQTWSEPQQFDIDTALEERIYCLSKTTTAPDISDSDAHINDYIPLPCSLSSYRGDFTTNRAYSIGQVVKYQLQYYKVVKNITIASARYPTDEEYFEKIPGWTDNPVGANKDYPFEFVAIRKKQSDGLWGPFVTSVWSNYGIGTNYIHMGWWDPSVTYSKTDLGIPLVKKEDGTGFSAYTLKVAASTLGSFILSEWDLVESADFIYMQQAYIERLWVEMLKADTAEIGGIKINANSLGVASPDPNAPSITEGIYFDNATLKLWQSASQSNKSILITSDGVELVSYSISGSYNVKLETAKITVSSNITGYGESVLEIRPDGIYKNGTKVL